MKFSIGNVVGKAIRSFEEHWPRLLIASLIVHVIGALFIASLYGIALSQTTSLAPLLVALLLYAPLFGIALFLGFLIFTLGVCREENPEYSELFSKFFFVAPFYAFIVSFLYMLAIVFGLVCLIVPGLIALARLSLAEIVLADISCGPFEALLKSNQLVRGATARVLAVLILGSWLAIIPLIGPILWGLVLIQLYLILVSKTPVQGETIISKSGE